MVSFPLIIAGDSGRGRSHSTNRWHRAAVLGPVDALGRGTVPSGGAILQPLRGAIGGSAAMSNTVISVSVLAILLALVLLGISVLIWVASVSGDHLTPAQDTLVQVARLDHQDGGRGDSGFSPAARAWRGGMVPGLLTDSHIVFTLGPIGSESSNLPAPAPCPRIGRGRRCRPARKRRGGPLLAARSHARWQVREGGRRRWSHRHYHCRRRYHKRLPLFSRVWTCSIPRSVGEGSGPSEGLASSISKPKERADAVLTSRR